MPRPLVTLLLPLFIAAAGLSASPMVFVEDSPAAVELLHGARRLADDGRLVEAALAYQKVIDEYGRKLVSQPAGGYADARDRAVALIRSDPRVLSAYREAHRAAAEQLADDVGTDRADPDSLSEVLERYELCEAGLESALHLAALRLYSADPEHAIALLDRVANHPDLPSHRTRWLFLQAAAGLFAGDPSRYTSNIAALLETGETEDVERLGRWEANLRPARDPSALSAGEILPRTDLPDSLGVPLWTMHLETSPTRLADQLTFRRTARRRRAMRPLPEGFAAQPTAVEGRLYANDAGTVYAVDASSGRVVWRYRSDAFDDPTFVQRVARQLTQIRSDARGVCVYRGTLVTVLGYGIPQRGNNPGVTHRTTLVCLDRADGAEVWKVHPADLDPSLATAMFYGTPVVWSDYVIALLSRTQTSGFTATYAVALDAATGEPVWWRHLWSRPAQRGARTPGAAVTLHEGDLYVTDNLSAVARVAADDGAIRWLQELPSKQPEENDNTRRRRQQEYPQPSAAVVADTGVVVLTRDPDAPIVLLDPSSGSTIRRVNSRFLRECYYLKPAPGGVLAVGPSIEFLDGGTLRSRWSRRLDPPVEPHRGFRATVTARRVLLPGKKHLVVMDLEDGSTLSVNAIEAPGHVLALPEQVLISGNDRLQSYQAWEQAHRHLAAQIRERPADPLPALALAHIALAANKRDVALKAVDRAISALAQRATADERHAGGEVPLDVLQRRVFRQVLKFVQTGQHTDPGVRLRLFERLATLAKHPADRVAYRLALGDSLSESGQYPEAVARYQQVIEDRALAVQIYDLGDGPVNAEFEARRRISHLITQYGREVYSRYETLAAQRVVELSSSEQTDPSAYTQVARAYPFARSSLVATIAAADALTRRGEHRQAAVQLRRAYRQTKEVGLLQRIVGRLARAHTELGEPRRASNLLRRVQREYGSLRPLKGGRPTSIDRWLAELESTPAHRPVDVPLIGRLTGESAAVNEQLLLVQGRPSVSRDGSIFTIDRMTLRCRAGAELEERWRYELPNRQAGVLSVTDDQVLLRCGVPGVLIALDLRTGRPHWPAVSVQELLMVDGADPEEAALPSHRPAQRVIAPVDVEPFALPGAHAQVSANESIVCVAGMSGLLVGVDRRSGEVIWRYVNPMGPVRSLQLNEQVVVVDAQTQGGTVRRTGSVLVIDAVTGEPWHPPIVGRQQVRWVGVGEDELMVVATTSRVAAYDLYTGKVRWWLPVAGMPVPAGGVVSDDLVLVQLRDRVNTVYALNTDDGHIAQRIVMQASSRWEPMIGERVGDQWQVLSGSRAVALDAEGALIWQDAVHSQKAYHAVSQVVGRDHVYLFTTDANRRVRRRVGRQGGGNQVEYLYNIHRIDRADGRVLEDYQVQLPAAISPSHVVGTEHGIIYTAGGRTTLLKSTH